MEDDSEVVGIVKAAATVLGTIEDVEIVGGTDPAAPYGKNSEPTLLFCDVRSNFALVLEHPLDFLSITACPRGS
jgi:hypothetical protein